jgi:serine/threonine protein phosphatase PrpC
MDMHTTDRNAGARLMDETGLKETQLFAEVDMPEVVLASAGEGTVGVFTARSPEKATVNEDAAIVVSLGADSGVVAIADGVGGFRAGEQASRIALTNLVESLERAAAQGGSLRDAILTGIERANQAVLELGIGAGTTLAVVEIQGHTIRTYHVGDSMVLVVGQRGKIKLQTISHSPVGYAVEAGVMDQGEAMQHAERHLVSNLIGTPDMRVEIGSTLDLDPKDTVVVASDGLFDNLHIDEIADTIRRGRLDQSLADLVSRARQRMMTPGTELPCKPDDLSVVVYRLGHGSKKLRRRRISAKAPTP